MPVHIQVADIMNVNDLGLIGPLTCDLSMTICYTKYAILQIDNVFTMNKCVQIGLYLPRSWLIMLP